MYLARIGRPAILWSVNKLARSVTKWTQACDTFITQTIFDNTDMWETRRRIADGVCFKTQTLLATLRTQNQPQEVSCVFLEVESHSSTESEIISLDARLRMDGLLALDLWDIVIEVLRSNNNTVQPKHNSIQKIGAPRPSMSKGGKV